MVKKALLATTVFLVIFLITRLTGIYSSSATADFIILVTCATTAGIASKGEGYLNAVLVFILTLLMSFAGAILLSYVAFGDSF